MPPMPPRKHRRARPPAAPPEAAAASEHTGAARAAGHPCVAVSFGYRARPVEELGADAVIDHYDALIPTLARL